MYFVDVCKFAFHHILFALVSEALAKSNTESPTFCLINNNNFFTFSFKAPALCFKSIQQMIIFTSGINKDSINSGQNLLTVESNVPVPVSEYI